MLAILGIGGWEMVLILTLVLLLSGAKLGSGKGGADDKLDLNAMLLFLAGSLVAFLAVVCLVDWLKS